MKLVRLFVTLLLLVTVSPAHSMGYFSWYATERTEAQEAQEANQTLQAMDLGPQIHIPPKVIEDLVRQGANPNVANHQGVYPLMFAVELDRPATVKFLLEHNANPDVTSPDHGYTPLIRAVMLNQPNQKEIVNLLLKHKANPNIQDSVGVGSNTALIRARDNSEIVEALLQHSADQTIKNSTGRTALSIARAKGYNEVIKLLEQYQKQRLP